MVLGEERGMTTNCESDGTATGAQGAGVLPVNKRAEPCPDGRVMARLSRCRSDRPSRLSPPAPARARHSDTPGPSGRPRHTRSAAGLLRGRILLLLTAMRLAQTENADGSTTIWEATLTVKNGTNYDSAGYGFYGPTSEGALTSTSFRYDNRTFGIDYFGIETLPVECTNLAFNIFTNSNANWNHAESSWVLHLGRHTLDFGDAILGPAEATWCGVTHTILGWSDGSVVPVKIVRRNLPSAPTNLTARADGQTRIYLSWDPPSKTGGSAITGYRIEVSPDAGTTWTDLATVSGALTTYFVHSGLTAGTTNRYRVSAINAIGTGDVSHTTTASTDLAPGGIFASGSDTEFWSETVTVAAHSNGLGYAFGTSSTFRYKGTDYGVRLVYYSTLNGDLNVEVTSNLFFELTSRGDPDFAGTALDDNWTLHVDGEAFAFSNADFVSRSQSIWYNPGLSWTVGQRIALKLTTTEPGAPGRLMAVPGAESVALHWSAPSSTGASPITGYQYRLRAAGGSWGGWTAIANSAGKTGYVVAGLSHDTEYTFQLRAVNASGAGLFSNTEAATTDPPPTAVVVDVTVASSPHHGSTYWLGETFEAHLRFDRAVVVAGQSVLMGLSVTDCTAGEDDWRGATYAGGSGTATDEDDGETLTLTLSNPGGAELLDAEATGTIRNTEAAPVVAGLSATYPPTEFTSTRHTGRGDFPHVVVAFSEPVAGFGPATPSVAVTGKRAI